MTAVSIENLDPGLEPEPTPAPEPPPPDVYRLLHVLPTAPRDLIEEAYWVLATRITRQTGYSSRSARYVAALNWAYELAIRACAAQAFIEEQTTPDRTERKRGWPRFFSRHTPEGPRQRMRLGYYDLLCVQPHATVRIIELAGTILLRSKSSRSDADAAMRELISVAQGTLRNPVLRAEHDALLGLSVAEEPHVAVTQQESRPALDSLPASTVEKTADTGAIDTSPADGAHASGDALAGSERAYVPQDVLAASSAAFRPLDDEPEQIVCANDAASLDRNIFKDGETLVADATRPRRKPMHAWFADRIKWTERRVAQSLEGGGSSRASQTPARPPTEDSERLMTPDPLDASARFQGSRRRARVTPPRQWRAELRFTAGSRRGDVIPIGDTVVTLGSEGESDEPFAGADAVGTRYGRIWRQGDHYIFRLLDDANVTVCGERLLIPVVVLEHGDDISAGDDVLTFNARLD